MRFERTVVVEALGIFSSRNPGIDIQLMSLDTPDQIQALHEGRIEVGFLRLPVADPALVAETVLRSPMVIGLPRKHRLAKHRVLPLSAIAGEPAIMFRRSLNPLFYDQIIQVCRNAGFDLNIVHEANELFSAMTFVEAGLGLAMFPATARDAERKGIVFRDIRPPVMHAECGVVYRLDNQSPALHSFLAVVREVSVKYL